MLSPGRRSLPPSAKSGSKFRRVSMMCLLAIVSIGLLVTNAARLHLLGSEPVRVFPSRSGTSAPTAVFLSGDMGFRFGLSGNVAAALAHQGIPVIGIVSPAAFAHHRTLSEATAIVEQAMHRALQVNRSGRIILMGESFGADVMATVAPRLPPALLAHVDAIILTVPAPDVYLRSDPSGLAYLGTADAHPLARLQGMRGPPLICIYGREEQDSLCPALKPAAAEVIALPGGHFLNHDPACLIATTLRSLHRFIPGTRGPPSRHDRNLSSPTTRRHSASARASTRDLPAGATVQP